jgi:hypothetical protein
VFDGILAMLYVCYKISDTNPVQRCDVCVTKSARLNRFRDTICAIAVQRCGMGAVGSTMLLCAARSLIIRLCEVFDAAQQCNVERAQQYYCV